jgi:1-aminocyclopropane-1-carboxylate deaminase
MLNLNLPSPIQPIHSEIASEKKIGLYIKRDDLIHPQISGNKWRKLKYNILHAKEKGYQKLVTFGGAYSNHLYAFAAACKNFGINGTVIIRGEKPKKKSHTIEFAEKCGLKLIYTSRENYRKKDAELISSIIPDKDFFLIPEGGSNDFALMGLKEMMEEIDEAYNFICCPVGTGGTISGILKYSNPSTKVIGFPVLKGVDYLIETISKFSELKDLDKKLIWASEYHFGGYAKINQDLIEFTNNFYQLHQIPLDLVYTSKMMYGVLDMIKKDMIPENSKMLVIHTGGLQGNIGMKERLKINLSF